MAEGESLVREARRSEESLRAERLGQLIDALAVPLAYVVAFVVTMALMALVAWLVYGQPAEAQVRNAIVSTLFTEGVALGIEVHDTLAYVADGEAGLAILSVADSLAPCYVSQLDLPGYAEGVTVLDGFAYVAASTSGLYIVDVRDPAAPALTDSLDLAGTSYDVTSRGIHIYVASGAAGLTILCACRPGQAELLLTFETDVAWHVDLIRSDCASWVFLMGPTSLTVVEIPEPSRPRLAWSYPAGMMPWQVVGHGLVYDQDFDNGLRYLAAGSAGLVIAQPRYRWPVATFRW